MLLQLHLHSRLNAWVQWIGQRQNCKTWRETFNLGNWCVLYQKIDVVSRSLEPDLDRHEPASGPCHNYKCPFRGDVWTSWIALRPVDHLNATFVAMTFALCLYIEWVQTHLIKGHKPLALRWTIGSAAMLVGQLPLSRYHLLKYKMPARCCIPGFGNHDSCFQLTSNDGFIWKWLWTSENLFEMRSLDPNFSPQQSGLRGKHCWIRLRNNFLVHANGRNWKHENLNRFFWCFIHKNYIDSCSLYRSENLAQ